MRKLFQYSMIIIAITVFSKFYGLVREAVTANYLGTSALSDAYILGITISQIVIAGFAGNFFKTYIPIAVEERNKKELRFSEYTFHLIVSGTIFFILITGLLMISADQLIRLLGKNASKEVLKTAIFICKWTAIPSAFLFDINILQGYLHVQNAFYSNLVYPVVMNTVIIIALVIVKPTAASLVLAYNGSIIATTAILGLICIKHGLKLTSVRSTFGDEAVVKTIVLTMPLFFGGLVSELNEIIDRVFSTKYAVGVLSALRYGKLLEIFVVSALGIAIGQAVYPTLAAKIDAGDYDESSSFVSNIINLLIIVSVPVFVFIVVIGTDLVEFVFGRGAFDAESIKNTSIAFKIYSLSILPVSINEILCRVYFSLKNTKHPVMCSMISMGINIVLNFIAVFIVEASFEVLALTTSISETLFAILLAVILINKTQIKLKIRFEVIYRVIISTVVMILFIHFFSVITPKAGIAKMILIVVEGAFGYVTILACFYRNEIRAMISKKCDSFYE